MVRTWNRYVGWLGTMALVMAVAACPGSPPPEPEPEPEPVVEESTDDEAARRAAEEARRRAEEEAARREAERQRALSIIAERVHFDFDKSDIRSDAEAVLQRKVSVLREYPDVALRIEGHADERGSNEYNLALGQRRAESVRRYLMSYGLEAGRFTTISFGEERPLVDASNENAWGQNRRAEFVVTEYGRLSAED